MFASAVLLAMIPLSRRVFGSWLHPSVLYAAVWSGVVFGATLAFPTMQELGAAGIWVAVTSMCVFVGSLVVVRDPPHTAEDRAGHALPWELAAIQRQALLFAGVAVLMAGIQFFESVGRQGLSLREMASFVALSQLTAQNRADFIYGDMRRGLVDIVGLFCLYLCSLGGGLVTGSAQKWSARLLGTIPILATVFAAGIFGSRMGALYGGGFWLGGMVAATVLKGGAGETGGRPLAALGMSGSALLFGGSVAIQFLRYSAHTARLDWHKILADGLSFFAAFSLWFDRAGFRLVGITYGGRYFRKFAAVIGNDVPIAPAINVGSTSSNIFTIQRDLIDDFGHPGALVFWLIFGLIAGRLFERVRAGDGRSLGALAVCYAMVVTAVAFSIYSYSVTTAVSVLVPLAIWAWKPLSHHPLIARASTEGEQ